MDHKNAHHGDKLTQQKKRRDDGDFTFPKYRIRQKSAARIIFCVCLTNSIPYFEPDCSEWTPKRRIT
jgi:hypothetical protein